MDSGKVTIEESPVQAGNELRLPSKKLIPGLMVALVIYVIVRSVVGAATRPFLYDEVLTQVVSSQPNLRTMWEALARGVDGQVPFFYLCERGAGALINNKDFALRLPSILAFPCTLICVFVYVKKRGGEVAAFLCTLLLLLTSLFHIYAIDARPYSLAIACIAFALVCYQRLPSVFWTAMLGISLALAQSLHYYAVLALAPFGLAEAVLFLRTRQFRWKVWTALALGVVPLAVFWPLLSHLRTYYGPHLWTHYDLSSIPETYGSFFLTGGAFGAAAAVVSAAGVIGSLRRRRVASSTGAENKESELAEGALVLALLALPFVGFVAATILHGVMVDRYVLAAAIGVCLAMGYALTLARPEIVALFAFFVFSSVGLHELSFWRSTWRHPFTLNSPAPAVEDFVRRGSDADLPVVVSDSVAYLPLAHYASPAFARKFVFLVDEHEAVTYMGTDNLDKNLLVLRSYAPFQVDDYSQFTSSHREFLLYVEEPVTRFDWLTWHLSHEASLRLMAMEQNRRLYLVSMKNAVPAN
jgi:hypothetical protein